MTAGSDELFQGRLGLLVLDGFKFIPALRNLDDEEAVALPAAVWLPLDRGAENGRVLAMRTLDVNRHGNFLAMDANSPTDEGQPKTRSGTPNM